MLERSDDYSKSEILQLSEAKQRLSLKDGPKGKAIAASKPSKSRGCHLNQVNITDCFPDTPTSPIRTFARHF